MLPRRLLVLLPLGLLAGCRALPDVGGLAREVEGAVGVEGAIVFRAEGGAVDAGEGPEGMLTAAGAVRLALMHDPEIQAALARVRVALAEAKQTRLLPNPILSVALRIPETGGSPTIEAALAAELLSLVQRPRQMGAADHRVRGAAEEVLTAALDVVAEVEERYTQVQAIEAEIAVLVQRREIVERMAGIAQARLKAGEAARLDVLTLDAQRADLDLEIVEKEAERADGRLVLARLMGRPSLETEWEVAKWSAPGAVAGTEKDWVEAALRHRPEVRGRMWELAALGDEAALSRLAFLEGSGGIDAERDGTWGAGPAVDLPLPVFDWGQAKRERADAKVAEARHELTKARRQVVEEVRRAWAAVVASGRAIEKAQTDLIPVQERRLAQAESQYRSGQADVTAVLLAQQDAQASQSRLLALQKNLSLAHHRLERAVGGAGVAPRVGGK